MMHTNTTMQAAVLHRAGDFRMEWVPRKEPANGEVEIRLLCNGICGSDVHFYREGRLGPFVVDRPYIPGHECSGIVSSVGSGVTTVREGDRVVAEPGIPCRHCHHCLSGRYNLCTEVRFLSAPPIDGTLAEYVVVPDLWAHPFPDSLEAEVAALAEPFAVGLHAIRRGGVQLGQKVAIVGVGPIGLVTLLCALAAGAGPIIVIDTVPARLDLALRLGAAVGINAREADPVAVVHQVTNGHGADVVLETAGNSGAAALTIEVAGRGSTVVQVGWPEAANISYPLEMVIDKELMVVGSNRYAGTFPAALELLASGKVDAKQLISHRYPFSKTPEAFAMVAANPQTVIKTLILHS